jgi:hypothetical protein
MIGEHKKIQLPKDCIFCISPSSIGKFFDHPKEWYEENILGIQTFKGNTATMLGSVCHYIYECYAKDIQIKKEEIDNWLRSLDTDENTNVNEIIETYPNIVTAVINKSIKYIKPTQTEFPVITAVKDGIIAPFDGIYVGGTCDSILGSSVIDYKTVAAKPNEYEIPFSYKMQLLAYAYALRDMGYFIDRIRIIYGVKPTKTLPARCYEVTEQISKKHWQDIHNTLQLIGESVLAVKKQPELTHLIFKSMALKQGE